MATGTSHAGSLIVVDLVGSALTDSVVEGEAIEARLTIVQVLAHLTPRTAVTDLPG